MTYGNLTEIQRRLRELSKIKKAQVDELNTKLIASPDADRFSENSQTLYMATLDSFELMRLSEIVREDINRLQGVGNGDLFARISPKSAMLSAIEEISEEIRNLSSNIQRYIRTSECQNERRK